MSRDLLEHLNSIPFSPKKMLYMSLIFYIFLVLIIYYRDRKQNNYSIYDKLSLVELALMLAILYSLRYSYNGVVLLVLMDIFYDSKEFQLTTDKKHYLIFALISLFTLLFTNYDLISSLINAVSIDPYIHMYPNKVHGLLIMGRQVIISLNLITFMIWLLLYILTALKEKQQIEAKLQLAAQANRDLENYMALSEKIAEDRERKRIARDIHDTLGHALKEKQQIEAKLQLAAQANRDLENYMALSEKIAEDRERKRIARDIHDTLGHALTGISAGLDAVDVLVDTNPSLAKQQLRKISKAVRDGLSDVRRSLKNLRPTALENATLEEAMKNLCKEYEALSHLKIHFNYNWGNVDFEVVKEDSLFRIIQESITNTVRHGHAQNIWIDLDANMICYNLIIYDDGVGENNIKMGYGLKQIKERVYALGGEIKFNGEKGFRIEITLPK